MDVEQYKVRVVRGAFIDPSILDDLGARVIEKTERKEWVSIDELTTSLEGINKLQSQMTKHHDNNRVPWYLDGYSISDKDKCIVAFGADDGEDGKLFQFNIKDKETVNKIIDYGISKGIPREQLDWMDIKF